MGRLSDDCLRGFLTVDGTLEEVSAEVGAQVCRSVGALAIHFEVGNARIARMVGRVLASFLARRNDEAHRASRMRLFGDRRFAFGRALEVVGREGLRPWRSEICSQFRGFSSAGSELRVSLATRRVRFFLHVGSP